MKESKITGGTNRREFIQHLTLCYVAAQIPFVFSGCKDDKPNFVGTGKAPYKVWEEMLMALQTCPDNLEGRMQTLIAAKDAEAMFHFVRDEIYLMPASTKSIGSIGSQFKWGIKGALRYGMATPREKAELLNQMFTEAGIASKVVYERTDIHPDEAKLFFLRPIERKFNMEISKKQWRQWEDELQIEDDVVYEIPVFDPDFVKTNALAEKLWNFIPHKEKLKTADFDFRWDNYRTPTVAFEVEGVTKYAHLFDPQIPFGALKNNGGIKDAEEVRLNEETIAIKISYREAIHPDKEIEMISGTWKATELIGNQIQFSCLNGLSLEQSAITPIGNLRIFTPSLAYQEYDAALETMQERSFIADPFTLEGEKIVLPEKESLQGPVVLQPSNTQLLKTVHTVTLKAIPVNKPLVRLEVRSVDSSGKFVEGLQANDFNFSDNNNPIQALMESNRPTPRILILYDESLSMPQQYHDKNMEVFVALLKENILTTFPSAIITAWGTPSELFTWLLKGSKTNNDLIVFATDGDNGDVFNEKDLEAYKGGPPAIILDVNNTDSFHKRETFKKMAEITNGSVLNAQDQSATIEKIVNVVNAMDIAPYVFTYYANKETQHEAVLQMDKKRLEVKDSYAFLEAPDLNSINQGIIGVYLDLKTGNTKVRRVLAGWDPLTQIGLKPNKANLLDAKGLILGETSFYFEGEGPTLSTSLVDLLKYKLSTRGWGEALLDDVISKAKEEFKKGGYSFQPNSMPLMAPIENGITEDTFTFASGIRIGIFKQIVNVQDKKVSKSFDYLPTSNYVSFSKNEESAFRINLQKTAQLAIREASLYDKSTLSVLKDIALLEREEAISSKWFENIDRNDLNVRYWYERIYRGDGNYKLFDKSGAHTAYWQINNQGELYGILKDGTGGGSHDDIIEQLSDIMAVISVYIALTSQMGILSGTSLSIVATYGVTLTKLYAIVCETIAIMDASGMDDKIKAALKELACNVIKAITYGITGGPGNIMTGIDSFIGMVVGSKSPLVCQ